MHLDLLRSFLIVVELGSLNRAAERLRLSQSTLTRQIRSLEHEIGGGLFERSPHGMALTATGHALAQELAPVLSRLDAVLGTARRLARGQSASLRVGYVMSASAAYLNPALAELRQTHPEVKVRLLDLSPGEQLAALGRGEIDVALLGLPAPFSSKDVYLRRLATLPVVAALSEQHPLAGEKAVELKQLKSDVFIGASEVDLPSYNRWLVQVGRRARFRPKVVAEAESLTHGLSLVVTEGAVSLLPSYAQSMTAPGVVFRPLADRAVAWELVVAWQRGKASEPVKAILRALSK